MLCREIIAVCSQIHTKHINTQGGQNVELLNVNLAAHIVTIVLYTQLTSYMTHTCVHHAITMTAHSPNTHITICSYQHSEILSCGRRRQVPR